MEDLTTTTCPEIVKRLTVADGFVDIVCGAEANVIDRYDLPSNHGRVQHETTECQGSPSHIVTRRLGDLIVGESALREAKAVFDGLIVEH